MKVKNQFHYPMIIGLDRRDFKDPKTFDNLINIMRIKHTEPIVAIKLMVTNYEVVAVHTEVNNG